MKQCHSVIDSSPIALGSHGGVRSGAELAWITMEAKPANKIAYTIKDATLIEC